MANYGTGNIVYIKQLENSILKVWNHLFKCLYNFKWTNTIQYFSIF